VAVSKMGLHGKVTGMLLGIDPGRGKCGWALAAETGVLIASGMFDAHRAEEFLGIMVDGDGARAKTFALEGAENMPPVFAVEEYLLGDGTGKESFLSLAKRLSFRVKLVSEKGTTLRGRRLYWEHNPPVGLKRFLPEGLRIPPREVDDFAALAIILEFIESQRA
jgi:RNase H-fold protein (predicted Holliday junction resolvase)